MGNIYGTVRDIVSNNPLPSVNVNSFWGDTITGSDGRYSIGVFYGATGLIKFSKTGYESVETWLSVGPGENVIIDAYLKPLPSGEIEVLGHWICGSIDSNGNPLDIKNEFTESEDIYHITKFGFNYGGLVEWKWYRNNVLYYDGNPQTIPHPSEYGWEWWNWYQVWFRWGYLPVGNWHVDVYFNGKLTLRDNFTVGIKDIEETIRWEGIVDSGSHNFYLLSFYGVNTNNTIEGFQIEKGEYMMVNIISPRQSRQDSLTTSNVSKDDCLTIIAEDYDSSTRQISGIYDVWIQNSVM